MISMQVGFIAQLKGSLTKKWYTAATVFTNHYSRLQYIHLMTRLTSQETVDAKPAFESSMVCKSWIIIATMVDMPTTISKMHAQAQINVSPSAASMFISKME
jgi:hypothetical protein